MVNFYQPLADGFIPCIYILPGGAVSQQGDTEERLRIANTVLTGLRARLLGRFSLAKISEGRA